TNRDRLTLACTLTLLCISVYTRQVCMCSSPLYQCGISVDTSPIRVGWCHERQPFPAPFHFRYL
ncbi:hypothetical protein J6590_087157, partial [Homalodisca vitripennis]